MTNATDRPLEPGFELFEVTADVGVVARGPTPEAALAEAARGMYAVMVELDGVRNRESRVVELRADDLEHLLERWLLELLFLTESEDMLFSRFEVTLGEAGALRATAYGEPIDVERHVLGPEVKAITRHQLGVRPVAGGYEARVVFDI
ncbi:MAG: archease [Dehalococcoidia bacterium]